MANIGLQEYFALSELIEKKDPRICNTDNPPKDIKSLKKLITENKIKKLSKYVKSYNRIRFFLWIVTFIVSGFIFSVFFKEAINITAFLFWSIIVPILIFLGSLLFYCFNFYEAYLKKPLIESMGSIIRFILTRSSLVKENEDDENIQKIIRFLKADVEYDERHSRVLQAYSFRFLQEVVVVYTVTIFIVTIMSYFIYFAPMYYGSVFDIKSGYSSIINFLSLPWSWFTTFGIPSNDLINAAYTKDPAGIEMGTQGTWAAFLSLSVLFWVIIPKMLLWTLVKLKL